MNERFETISVVGSTNHRWGQTFVHEPYFIVIEIETGERAFETGHAIMEQLTERLSSTDDVSLQTLKNIIQSLETPPSAALAIVAPQEDVLYVASRGGARVFIRRGERWGTILNDDGYASGPLEQADLICLCTPSFLANIPAEKIRETVMESPHGELEDNLATLLHDHDDTAGAACLIITQKNQEQSFSATDETEPAQEESPAPEHGSNTFRSKVVAHLPKPNKKQRITLTIGMVLLFLLIGSLVFGSSHRNSAKRKETVAVLREEVTAKLSEGTGLINHDREQAQQVLGEAVSRLEQTLPTFPTTSPEYEELANLLNTTQKELLAAQRIWIIEEAPLFSDLTWIEQSATGSSFSLFETTLAILDTINRRVYTIDLAQKQTDVVMSGDGLNGVRTLAAYGKDVFIARTEGERGIVSQDGTVVAGADNTWTDIVTMNAFAGNLYLLDRAGVIWKYARGEEGYGSATNYLADDVSVDLSDSRDMAIDGHIWILGDNDIFRFAAGAPEAYFLKGDVLTSARAFYTDGETELIYVLEDTRIVVFDKTGDYHSQYRWPGFSDATDIIVSATENKILVLAGSKIYGIDSKN